MVGLGHIATTALLVCGQNGGTAMHPICISFYHQKPRGEGTHPNDPDNSREKGGKHLRDESQM